MKSSKNRIKEFKELLILIIVALTIKTCLIEIYVVPTGSMENTILIGDMLIGNKFIYGMRTPDWIGIPYTRIGFYIPSYRLPKFKDIKNDDVVIFEFPRDPFQKYVKRCIGLPNDKIEIINGNILVNGISKQLPEDGQFVPKFGNYNKQFLKRNNFPSQADTLRKYLTNHTWFSHSLYPDFKPESYTDINRNAQYDMNIDIFDKERDDFNKNNEWDYGNADNIKEFTVPFKGMEIDLKSVKDWEALLILLLLDGHSLEINLDGDNWSFDLNDPIQMSRLKGLVRYKVLNIFFTYLDQDLNGIPDKQEREQEIYKRKLFKERLNSKLINPWSDKMKQKMLQDPSYIKNNLQVNSQFINDISKVTLNHDYYFMVGDNRNNSYDSRFWGFVPDYHILGIPVFSFINISKFKLRLEIVK